MFWKEEGSKGRKTAGRLVLQAQKLAGGRKRGKQFRKHQEGRMNSPWHRVKWEIARPRGVSMTPSLQLWQLRGDRALEGEQAFAEDLEFPVESEKSVGY